MTYAYYVRKNATLLGCYNKSSATLQIEIDSFLLCSSLAISHFLILVSMVMSIKTVIFAHTTVD